MLRALTKTAFLALLLIGGSAGLLYYYHHNSAEQQIAQLQQKNQELEQIRHRLETDRRVAKILVTDQKTIAGQMKTTLLFVEYTESGTELPAKQFIINGNEAHFDAEIIKFKDQYVEQGDPLRGQSIMLFVRVYGADQAPSAGFPIDAPGTIPEIYRGADPQISAFEESLWADFWKLYNDHDARESRGIRGLHGEGLYGQFNPGHVYTITLRSNGDGTINEEPLDPMYKQAIENR
ncbi:MAG TPA: hypothetical protein VGG44_07785 [Tepidisphaeraceae bacterium]|jgi:hypothetical protein